MSRFAGHENCEQAFFGNFRHFVHFWKFWILEMLGNFRIFLEFFWIFLDFFFKRLEKFGKIRENLKMQECPIPEPQGLSSLKMTGLYMLDNHPTIHLVDFYQNKEKYENVLQQQYPLQVFGQFLLCQKHSQNDLEQLLSPLHCFSSVLLLFLHNTLLHERLNQVLA
jgi:hypothetical protein